MGVSVELDRQILVCALFGSLTMYSHGRNPADVGFFAVRDVKDAENYISKHVHKLNI